ncbi:MAG: hypothetical protein WDM78_10025 [Puia sp.]
MAGVNKAVAKVNDLEQIASELAINKKYDFVICGHIHQPVIRTVENAAGKVVYMNSGDWVEHMTALEYENKCWRLFNMMPIDFPASNHTGIQTGSECRNGRHYGAFLALNAERGTRNAERRTRNA